MEDISKIENKQEEIPMSHFEKIIHLNKLGAIFLGGDKFDKALSILQKTKDFYLEKRNNKEIPNFFYSNLYCNLAKTYSCKKDFANAEPLYVECILNHPLYKIISRESEYFTTNFLFPPLDTLLDMNKQISVDYVLKRFEILMSFFDKKSPELNQSFHEIILSKYTQNNLHSLNSFTDSLVNLAVIFQYRNRETLGTFDMLFLALLCDQSNFVANVDLNNFLREMNLKEKSDEYIIRRIHYEVDSEVDLSPIIVRGHDMSVLSEASHVNFLCMKWGTKYGADYANKLFHGIQRYTKKSFKMYCITDDPAGLDGDIACIKLETNFKGWMKKCILFSPDYLSQIEGSQDDLLCFIDLDMIIYSSIETLWTYNGDFCLMKTDDIQCEASINGYNSSIVLWKKSFGSNICNYMRLYHSQLNQQIIRFDHYLEFVVKNADFIQNVFPGKVLDYNTYCKGKDILPDDGAIIAFPRSPKPHECTEKWIYEHWV